MNIQKLNTDHKKKWIISTIGIISIILTVTFIATRASWKSSSSIQLASGIINYSPSDLEIVAVKLQNNEGTYDTANEIPTSGYILNKEKTVCKVGDEIQDIKYKIEGNDFYIKVSKKGTKCELYFDRQLVGKDVILANNTSEGTLSSDLGTETNSLGTSYYFKGSNPNNWVSFGGFYWRIIRINEDNSIRLIYNGTITATSGTTTQIGTSTFNNVREDNTYMGFMYGSAGASSYANTHANTHSSAIKNSLDTWYTANLKTNYEQYIDPNAGFCNDRSLSTGTGIGTVKTNYAPYARSVSASTYECAQSNDLFTPSTSNTGNKTLVNPIGIITKDEAVFAAGKKSSVSGSWLFTSQGFWTMSPGYFPGVSSLVYLIDESGSITPNFADHDYGVRPVINLRSDIQLSGVGTTSSPYKIN